MQNDELYAKMKYEQDLEGGKRKTKKTKSKSTKSKSKSKSKSKK